MDPYQVPNIPIFSGLLSAFGPNLLRVMFLAAIVISFVFSLLLIYHWKNFSYDPAKSRRVLIVYFVALGILLVVMLFSLAAYLSSPTQIYY